MASLMSAFELNSDSPHTPKAAKKYQIMKKKTAPPVLAKG